MFIYFCTYRHTGERKRPKRSTKKHGQSCSQLCGVPCVVCEAFCRTCRVQSTKPRSEGIEASVVVLVRMREELRILFYSIVGRRVDISFYLIPKNMYYVHLLVLSNNSIILVYQIYHSTKFTKYSYIMLSILSINIVFLFFLLTNILYFHTHTYTFLPF